MADHADALFSIVRSLLDRTTPDLRGVCYELTESSLVVRMFYDSVPNDWDRENVSAAETECIADFWPLEVRYTAVHLPSPLPRDIAPGERWVFLRHEFQFDD